MQSSMQNLKGLTIRSCISLLAMLSLSVAHAEPVATLGPTLSKIAERGAVYVVHREAAIPFSYLQANTDTKEMEPTGYSWELCMKVVKSLEGVVGRPLKVVPVPSSANSRMMLVKIEMGEMECGATTNTVGRQKQVSFSNTVFVSEVKLLARADGKIKSLDDLAGKKVVVTAGTSADRLIRQAALARNIHVQVIQSREHREAMSMLAEGVADAFVGDDAILLGQRSAWTATSPSAVQDFSLLNDSLSSEPYGIVLPKDDEPFRKAVNQSLNELMASGEMMKLYDKWFMAPLPGNQGLLNYPLNAATKAVFSYPNDRPAN